MRLKADMEGISVTSVTSGNFVAENPENLIPQASPFSLLLATLNESSEALNSKQIKFTLNLNVPVNSTCVFVIS